MGSAVVVEKDNYNNKQYNELITKQDVVQERDFETFITELSLAPDKETIKRLLIELPSQILYLQNQILDYRRRLGETKVALKANKAHKENLKSEIRKKEMDKYMIEVGEFRTKSQELMTQVMNSDDNASLKKTYLQEMLRVIKPEKPTQTVLDDIAEVETYEVQKQINEAEEQIMYFQGEIDSLQAKEDMYDNMFISVRAYKGILIEEMNKNM